MNTRPVIRLILLVTIVLVCVFVALLILAPWKSATATSGPTVALLGFTNDPSGTRLALFSLSNTISREISYSAAIEYKERGAWQPPPWRTSPSTKVPAQHLASFAVTNPIEGTWRVSVLYQLTPTKRDELGFRIGRFFYRFKLYSVAKRIPTEKFKAYITLGPELTD